jgi:tetratricopeptide (TPR) repeat protein
MIILAKQHNYNAMIEEISDYIGLHMRQIEKELKRGVTPRRFELFCELKKAFSVANIVLHSVRMQCAGNNEHYESYIEPLVNSCFRLKKECENDDLEVGLGKILSMLGFIASTLQLTDFAMAIFNSLQMYRPKSEYPFIGKAIAQLDIGCYKEAVDLLRNNALRINPQNDLAKAILAMAYTYLKRNADSMSLVKEIESRGQSEAAVNLAKALVSAGT